MSRPPISNTLFFLRVTFVILFTSAVLLVPKPASAQLSAQNDCEDLGYSMTQGNPYGETFAEGDPDNKLDITVSGTNSNSSYTLSVFWIPRNTDWRKQGEIASSANGTTNRFTSTNADFFSHEGRHGLQLNIHTAGGDSKCDFIGDGYEVITDKYCKNVSITQTRNINGQSAMCYGGPGGSCIDSQSAITVTATIFKGGVPSVNDLVHMEWSGDGSNQGTTETTDANGVVTHTWNGLAPDTSKTLIIEDGVVNIKECSRTLTVFDQCDDTDPEQCRTTPPAENQGDITQRDSYKFCKQITDVNLRQKCLDCTEVDEDGDGNKDYKGVWTAIGCIKRDPEAIAQKLILVGLSTGGGVSMLMGLAAGFILSTSQGDPKRTSDAKDMMTAAVTGLLFIIFSVTILQFIGFTVLKIPGFGG